MIYKENILILGASSWMRLVLAPIDGRIAHASVGRRHVDFSTNATFLSTWGSIQHFTPHLEILFGR